jgi:hypothetical protein
LYGVLIDRLLWAIVAVGHWVGTFKKEIEEDSVPTLKRWWFCPKAIGKAIGKHNVHKWLQFPFKRGI